MDHLKVFLVTLALSVAASAQLDTNSQHYYLFSYFFNDDDDAGARLAVSTDAVFWHKINNEDPIIVPKLSNEKLMRDPCTYFDARSGVFHMVWTTGWNQQTIGYAAVKDLRDWKNSVQIEIPVGKNIPNCACCWAPEIFFDDVTDSFMVFWSTERGTAGKRGYYCMTKDFKNFTESTLFFDPGYSVIDETILKVADNDYYMFFKDERTSAEAGKMAKNIHFVTSTKPQGPWSLDGPWDGVSKPISNPGMEGPSALKIGDEYWIVFDPFTNFSNTYRSVRTTNLARDSFPWPQGPVFKTETGNFLFSHGTPLEIPRAKFMQLLYGTPDPTTYALAWEVLLADTTETYPLGKRNTGCGTGVGLALFPPLFFKAISLRKRRKKSVKAD
jgi:hypothetical protein